MMTKIKILFVLLALVVLGCKHTPNKKYSYMHSVIDSLKIDKSENTLIYTINPNDCMNCLIGFVAVNNNLSSIHNPKVYVISVEREIEKNKLIESITNVDLKDGVNKKIIWDKDVFIAFNSMASLKKEISLSALTIYNYQKDSILFNKPIKEIVEVEKLKSYLKSMP